MRLESFLKIPVIVTPNGLYLPISKLHISKKIIVKKSYRVFPIAANGKPLLSILPQSGRMMVNRIIILSGPIPCHRDPSP
jgi:hypothetical protein